MFPFIKGLHQTSSKQWTVPLYTTRRDIRLNMKEYVKFKLHVPYSFR